MKIPYLFDYNRVFWYGTAPKIQIRNKGANYGVVQVHDHSENDLYRFTGYNMRHRTCT